MTNTLTLNNETKLPSFTSSLETAIHSSLSVANSYAHELATLEHLLLALIKEPDAAAVMTACGVDLMELFEVLEDFIDIELISLTTNVPGSEAVPTAAYQRVIQRAAIHVQSSGRDEVTGANTLVAIFAERESNAAFFLQEQGMTRYDAVNFIAHGVAKTFGDDIEKLSDFRDATKKAIEALPAFSEPSKEKLSARLDKLDAAKKRAGTDSSKNERTTISKTLSNESARSSVAVQARCIQLLIQGEAERLKNSRPNFQSDEELVLFNTKVDFFNDLLERLDALLEQLLQQEEGSPANETANIADSIHGIKEAIVTFSENNREIVFWGGQMPAMLGFVSLFSMAGAHMITATPLIMGLCGGDRIIRLIKTAKDK